MPTGQSFSMQLQMRSQIRYMGPGDVVIILAAAGLLPRDGLGFSDKKVIAVQSRAAAVPVRTVAIVAIMDLRYRSNKAFGGNYKIQDSSCPVVSAIGRIANPQRKF